MKFIVFYFSGTGNTWWLMSQFKQMVEKDQHQIHLHSIEKIMDSDWDSIIEEWRSADYVGIAHPVFGSSAPKYVKTFLPSLAQKIPIDEIGQKKGFVFTTMELFSGDGGFVLRKQLKNLNIQLRYVYNFQMISNLGIPLITYNPVSEKRFAKRRTRTLKKLEKVYGDLLQERKYWQNLYNPLAYIFGWIQRVSMQSLEKKNNRYLGVDRNKCTECMQCRDNCPTHAIEFINGAFQFNSDCTACYRCYNFCPVQAITVFGRTAKPKRHRQHKLYIKGEYY